VRDLLVLGLLAFFAWAGVAVHDVVDSLSVLGSGVRTSGTAIEDGFGSAATAVDGIPIVGGDLAGALATAGGGTGGQVAALGREGEEQVHDAARVLGLATFALPAALLLLLAIPRPRAPGAQAHRSGGRAGRGRRAGAPAADRPPARLSAAVRDAARVHAGPHR
jgi:hypothetical protein